MSSSWFCHRTVHNLFISNQNRYRLVGFRTYSQHKVSETNKISTTSQLNSSRVAKSATSCTRSINPQGKRWQSRSLTSHSSMKQTKTGPGVYKKLQSYIRSDTLTWHELLRPLKTRIPYTWYRSSVVVETFKYT